MAWMNISCRTIVKKSLTKIVKVIVPTISFHMFYKKSIQFPTRNIFAVLLKQRHVGSRITV